MAPIASKSYRPSTVTSATLANLITQFAEVDGVSDKDVRISASYAYEDGSKDVTGIDPRDFPGLISLEPPVSSVTLQSRGQHASRLWLYIHGDRIDLEAEGDSASAARALVKKAARCLNLKPYIPPTESRLVSLERRLNALQELVQERRGLRCGLIYSVASADRRAATQVQRFLVSQGVEVVAGDSYEPRRIDDDRDSRFFGTVDFAVFLIESAGDAAALVERVTRARTAAVPVIPLVSDQVQLEGAVFGQADAILFAQGHIGDVWLALSEGLGHLRATKRRPRRGVRVAAASSSRR